MTQKKKDSHFPPSSDTTVVLSICLCPSKCVQYVVPLGDMVSVSDNDILIETLNIEATA